MKRIIYYIFALSCLLFCVSAKAASTLPSLEIKGITGDALKNVQSRLKSELAQVDTAYFASHAPEHIRMALEPYGYFKAKVNLKQGKTWLIEIDPGPPLTIAQVDFKLLGPGKDDPEIKNYVAHFPLAAGQILRIENYNKMKEDLFQLASNQGYLKAILEKKEIRVNLKTNTATIIFYFNTGPRYYFGHILFKPSPFAPHFLQRFASFKPNEPFSNQKLLKFKQDLQHSRYFQQVEAIPNFDQAKDLNIPIDVAVTAPKSQRYDVGIGYGTFTGPRLTLGTDFRRITDTGQHFNAQLKLSSVLSRLSAKYYIPGKNPLADQYILGANIQYFAPKNGSSFSETLSASYQKTVDDWQNSISVNYLNENYKITGKNSHISQVLYPNLTLSYLKKDNLISPNSGKMFSLTVQGASETFLSKTNFFQTQLKAKAIFSPTQDSRVILRGDLGYTVVENLNQLPLTLRFFAGGIGSVRGYPYSSIGPGKFLQVASAEYQHRIIGNWNGAIFYDVGNASDKFNSHFKRGDGAGIVYQSFIGPVKLYVGRALSKPDKPLSVEFSIGPEF